MDGDQGKIFKVDENTFNVLVILYNEYLSKPEYNNLEKDLLKTGVQYCS